MAKNTTVILDAINRLEERMGVLNAEISALQKACDILIESGAAPDAPKAKRTRRKRAAGLPAANDSGD